MIPLERERTLAQARRAIESFLARAGWSARIEDCGERLQAAICWLHDGGGEAFANGYGKGEREAARIGALYEAIEHAYANAQSPHERIELVPAQALADDPRYAALPFAAEFGRQGERRLSCRRYFPFFADDESDALAVPLFLVRPSAAEALLPGDDFDYSSVVRYGSNSGVAIGASVEEAAVHAIGELVERDSWSLFLAAHFLGDPASFGAWIEPGSLPEEVARVHAAAQRQLGREVRLIEATSDLGVPVFIATTDRIAAGEAVFPGGYGASLYAGHAAIRALSELVQAVLIGRRLETVSAYSRQTLEALAEYPKLRDCAYFQVDFERLPRRRWDHAPRERQAPAVLLRELLARLGERGIQVRHAINHREGDAFCVVSCVALELERFLLVTTGMVMAPGRRGMALLARARSAAVQETAAA